MAGPIATLAVRLSAQLAEFQTSFKDATKTVDDFKGGFDQFAAKITGTIDGVSKAFGQFGSVVGTIGVAVAGVTAAAGAAVVAFKTVEAGIETVAGAASTALKSTADLGDQFFTLAQQTGLSVEALSGFKFAAQQSGTNLEAITGAVFKLEANLGKGGKATAEAISSIGLSIQTLKSQAPEKAFEAILGRIGDLPNAADRASAGVAIFGKGFKEIASLAAEGSTGIKALLDQANDLGIVMSTKTAVAADRFHDGLGAIEAAASGLTQQLGAKLLPAAVAFTEVFGGIFIDAVKSVVASTKGAGDGFDRFVVFVGESAAKFLEVLARMVEGVAQWAVDISKRIADETRDFLDLAPAIIGVGRALDLALGGGTHQSAFDALEKNLAALRKPLDGFVTGAATAGAAVRTIASGIAESAKTAGDNFGETFARIQSEIAASADKMRASLKGVTSGLDTGDGEDAFKSFRKGLAELTAQVDRAAAHGTPLADMVRLFGKAASESADKADAWGIQVEAAVRTVANAFNQNRLDTVLDKLKDGFAKFFDTRAEQSFKKLQAGMHESAIEMVKTADVLKKLDSGFVDFFAKRNKEKFDGLAKGMHDAMPQVIAELTNPFVDAFKKLGVQLPQVISQGFTAGGTSGAIVAAADATAQEFGSIFQAGVERVAKDGGKITGKEFGAGMAAAALGSFVGGFSSGLQNPGTVGALTSVFGGLFAGLLVGGPAGAAVGAIAGLAGFLEGAFKNAKAEAAALGVELTKLETQFHGRGNLTNIAERAGFSLPTRTAAAGGAPATAKESIDALFASGNAEDFNKRLGLLNQALDAYNERLKALAAATDAVNARTATFAKQFAPLVSAKQTATDKGDTSGAEAAGQKIQELAQRSQGEFERLGVFVKDTFAGTVRESGNAIKAITDLAPSFQVLKDGISSFGLSSSGVIDALLEDFDLVNNEAFKPLFENIQTSGALFKSLLDAKALSPEGFQAAAADIGQSIQEIVNRGGDLSKALALSQPQLQALFEAEQQFGGVVDQTTSGILKQAEAQGIVGNQFKSTQEKTLDVLLAIAKVFHADIPDGLAATATAATTAGATFGTAFQQGANVAGAAVGGFADKIRTQVDPASFGSGVTFGTAFQQGADVAGAAVGGFADKIRTQIDPAGAEAASGFRRAFEEQSTAAGAAVGGFADKIRTQIDPASKEAADLMRQEFERQSDAAAQVVTANFTRGAIDSGIAIETEIGRKIIGIAEQSTTAGATFGTAFQQGATTAGDAVGGFADKILTQIDPAGAEAASGFRRAFEEQSAAAAQVVIANFTRGAIDSGAAIEGKIGGKIIGLAAQSKTAASDIESTFGRIKVPPITVPVELDLPDDWDRLTSSDTRIQFGVDPSSIPAFGGGGIVTKKTLAFVGERGPEAIVPLTGGSARPTPDGMRVIFEQDGRAAAEFIVPHIPGVVQRYRLA